MRLAVFLFLFMLPGCFMGRRVDGVSFDKGEYRIIHGQSYVCIQPNMETPWKEKCKHTKTGQVLDVEKIQIPTQN